MGTMRRLRSSPQRASKGDRQSGSALAVAEEIKVGLMRSEANGQFRQKVGSYELDFEASGIGLDIRFDDNVAASGTSFGEFGLERDP